MAETDEKCMEIFDVATESEHGEGFYQEQCWLKRGHRGKHKPASEAQVSAVFDEAAIASE